MTLQWVAVATFLYAEIGLILIFCLPFIPPQRVLRRLVTLITQLAKELSNKGVLKSQAENTNEAARKFMQENEKLKRVLKRYGKEEEHILEAENKKLLEDQEKLKTELKKTSDALSKAQNDVMTLKMQSERLSKEYDRLLKEHSKLQDRSGKDKKGL
uniref:B-cell receptor-associated protein n=1 Tax=Equus caballus TaxID=9796 RepID=A0A5F5PJR2_HORSE